MSSAACHWPAASHTYDSLPRSFTVMGESESTPATAPAGGIGMIWWVIPPMLVVGFLTPWPYNYWRLKKFGAACH